eukprot:755793-Hanusia_phi.AAC.1
MSEVREENKQTQVFDDYNHLFLLLADNLHLLSLFSSKNKVFGQGECLTFKIDLSQESSNMSLALFSRSS